VPDATGMSEAEMQHVATELGHSETAFVLPATDGDHDLWVRFFTPRTEVPSCGHATLAVHYVRAMLVRPATHDLRQKTGAGIQDITVVEADQDYTITMVQDVLDLEPPLDPEVRADVLAAMGLALDDVDMRCPVQVVSTGHSKVLVGVRSKDALVTLEPDMAQLAALSEQIGSNGYFVFTFDSPAAVLTRGRMFAPAIGINEDAATGNANGPLGAYLIHNNLVEHDGRRFEFASEQGPEVGLGGVVNVIVEIVNGCPRRVKVSGKVAVRSVKDV